MAHRKVIEITIKAVIDVDNDDFPEDKNSEAYTDQLEEAIEDFANFADVKVGDYGLVTVKSVETKDYDVTI